MLNIICLHKQKIVFNALQIRKVRYRLKGEHHKFFSSFNMVNITKKKLKNNKQPFKNGHYHYILRVTPSQKIITPSHTESECYHTESHRVRKNYTESEKITPSHTESEKVTPSHIESENYHTELHRVRKLSHRVTKNHNESHQVRIFSHQVRIFSHRVRIL